MIERLHISNYRSCLDTAIELQPHLSVFIGPNGSGKTNILNAYILIRRLADEREYHSSLLRDDQPVGESRLKATFLYDTKRAHLTAGLQLLTDDSNSDILVTASQSWYARDFTNSPKRIHLPLWIAAELDRPDFGPKSPEYIAAYWRARSDMDVVVPSEFLKPVVAISHFAKQIRYYSASQFTNPSQCPVSFEIDKPSRIGRRSRLRGHAKFLADLYNEYQTRSESRFDQFFDVVGPNGMGLVNRIAFKQISTSSIDVTVRSGGRIRKQKREKILVVPQFTIGKNDLSPSQLSEGTFKTITLLFYLMTEQSSALLIEEPEVCVHHGLLSSIVELIKAYSRRKQILVSTHSDALLDQIDPQHVYKVMYSKNAGTEVRHLGKSQSLQERSALKQFLATEGNLGEYWRHGGLD